MLYSVGECDRGLRPLDSFLQFTATLESPLRTSCGGRISRNSALRTHMGDYALSPQNLILANRAVVYNNMAQAWYKQGHLQHALWSLQNALEAMQEFHRDGGKEPCSNNTVPTLLSNMGHIHFKLGDHETALKVSIEAYHAHDGTEDEFRATLLFNLGRLMFLLDRNSEEAEYALTCALRILTTIDSESRERDVVTVQTLLLIIQEQREREFDVFSISLLRLLIHQRTELGYENESVTETLSELGDLYMKRNQHDHAAIFLNEALRVQRHIGMPDTDILLTLSRLGQCLHASGKHAEAMLCFREALRLKGNSIYQECSRVQAVFATVLYNVGMIQSVHGDQQDHMRRRRALQSFSICLQLRTKALGRMHPDVASVMHNIAFLLLQEGQTSKSIEMFQESLQIRCNTLGPNHHEVASSLRHIGRIYQDRGEYEKALELHSKAFNILQAASLKSSDDLVEVLMGLGQAQHATRRLDQALGSYQEVLKLLRGRRQGGNKESAHHIARVLNIMGNLLLDMSDVASANALFAEAASLSEDNITSVAVNERPPCAAAA